MRPLSRPVVILIIALTSALPGDARESTLERLPPDVLEFTAPSEHVRGEPGAMTIRPPVCRILATGETRRRIVDLAVQEWAFFGFRTVDHTMDRPAGNGRTGSSGPLPEPTPGRRRPSQLGAAEEARVAASVAGYWAVTPQGAWIVAKQNDVWSGPEGTAFRWNAPWSAAFVSWVMCEAGLGSVNQFKRAIAHHAYIDQAIRARDTQASESAFIAYDVGDMAIGPGDLLCTSRRPAYRRLAERRRQMGTGARSHCDVVVEVDETRSRVLAIGGNVRGTVSLKVLPAVRDAGKPLRLVDLDEDRPVFAHLKLRAAPIENTALQNSPAVTRALACNAPQKGPARSAASRAASAGVIASRC